jgi:superfamily II RNA helicase
VPLIEHVPPGADPDEVLDAFVDWVSAQGLEPYPHQEEALLEILGGSNVVLGTPTGSGKTLVALGAQLAALCQGRRTWYTAPIKALVSEKFFALVDELGAANVGMLTGDAAVNPDAPVICATAEVLAMRALRHGRDAGVDQVVMDEFHFYADPDRGWAWQVPLLELVDAQFVLMSATLGDVSFFVDDLTRRTGRPTVPVTDAPRPVPLEFTYVTTPLHETVAALLRTADAPIYVVHPTQAGAVEQAQALTSVTLTDRAGQQAIAQQLADVRFGKGFGGTLSRLLRVGIGVHHAGMLPRYRRVVERLAQRGLLTVICGTDTLGVGINVPIRTVLITSLAKFDGRRQRLLKAREFHQVAGRAGRAGFDVHGRAVVQAPEHEIENRRALAKAGDDPRKRRKVVRKKPPPGTVSWTEATFDRLVAAAPEPLTSRFRVTHAMVLAVLARPGDPVAALRHLIDDNHEPPSARRHHVHRTVAIVRSLLAGGVVERLDEPESDGRRYRLTVDLQEDFALNQPLSPFAVAAVDLLDRDDPGYALDVLSVVESTLEDPRQVLAAQLRAARGEAVAAMKADGVPYEERLELLEEVTYPRPLADLLEHAYDLYATTHPWVLDTELRPKSVARDCFERAATFAEYVSAYGLSRSEGVLLRYLADAAKAVRQTVPMDARTDEVTDLGEWLTEMVRQTDSSLLDEWEGRLDAAAGRRPVAEDADAAPPPVTANTRAFRVLVRNEMFRRVQALARRDYDAVADGDAADGWTPARYAEAMAPYWQLYSSIGVGPDARGPDLFVVEEGTRTWRVVQRLDDPQRHRDWALVAEVDLAASDDEGSAVLRVLSLGDLAQTWADA